ncbi:hypothetical protein C4587_02420 [Candidatus Parcubacteria bacterium]|nr:MAG: hypothetical protein C4587_02420 [Candidatus Parcubacteria bacterium]
MRNAETRTCQSCKNQFVIEPDDFGFYETMKVPPPTWCPKCRMIRRLGVRGYRILYKRKCDYTGEDVISTHHPDTKNKVYRQDIWWSDKWDAREYGRDYDFSKPFFAQYYELFSQVPLPALYTEYTTLVNSDYCNAAAELKNCYLAFNADNSENCAYLNTITNLKDCFDASFTYRSELCYEVVNADRCYRVFFSKDCEDSHDIWFSNDLIGCSDCFGCTGLRKKNYYIFNQPHSKADYERFAGGLNLGSYAALAGVREKSAESVLKYPRKENHNRKQYNSTGEYLENTQNVRDSYMAGEAKNIRYAQFIRKGPSENAYDYSHFAMGAEWIYESCWVGLTVNNIKFGFWNYKSHDLEYCFGCHGAGNLFGCVGIRGGEYCILNKQYSKEEYQLLVARIKRQMIEIPYTDSRERIYRYGEYFPPEFSPWVYNESNGYEWLPFSKEEAVRWGFSWRDPDSREYQEATVTIPDHIKDITDDILKGILKCDECGKNYQIIRMELDFYRRMNIPIPRECPLCRDRARIKQLNPIAIHDRKCAKCGKDIKTSYAPARPEIVYCESCYNAEVV